MTDVPPKDGQESSEARLDELLAEVRGGPVPRAEGLTERVVRAAGWQRGVRSVLVSLSSLSAGIAEGLGRMLGVGRRRGDDGRS